MIGYRFDDKIDETVWLPTAFRRWWASHEKWPHSITCEVGNVSQTLYEFITEILRYFGANFDSCHPFKSQICTSWQQSCRDMCKIVIWLDHYLWIGGKSISYNIWIMSSQTICETRPWLAIVIHMSCENPFLMELSGRCLKFETNHMAIFVSISCHMWPLVGLLCVFINEESFKRLLIYIPC